MKKFVTLLSAFCLSLSMLAGCASPQTQTAPAAAQKPVMLVVSFGTSYHDTRDVTIGAIESALRTAYPTYDQRRAFTSQTILDILQNRDGLLIDNVTQAMERLVAEGVQDVVVQPTHVIAGFEYDDLVKEVSAFAQKFTSLSIGLPLLSADEDYNSLADALAAAAASYDAPGTAIVWMGHGTHHAANESYTKLQQVMRARGYGNHYIGTVEAAPTADDILAELETRGLQRVVLMPLMIVAGDHATNDMAGEEEDSWKTLFTAAGYDVVVELTGLGQLHAVREMFVSHAGAAMNAQGAVVEIAPPASSAASSALPSVQTDALADGAYTADVESSSSMFNVVECLLRVQDGGMTARITMSGDGYGKMFMGTAEEAAAAQELDFIPAEINADGAVTFLLPIEALDKEIVCAAWSKKKETWYDRTLTFSAAQPAVEAQNG